MNALWILLFHNSENNPFQFSQKKKLSPELNENTVARDQTASFLLRLIWMYTVCKGTFLWER